MTAHPVNLTLVRNDVLQIDWSDQAKHALPIRMLRDRCPCATCRELRNAPPDLADPSRLLNVLRPEETQPLRIVGMRPVGNYAYAIHFSDGHDTGIYTLEFLRQLGENPKPPTQAANS